MASTRGRPPHNDRLTPAEWRTVDAVRHGLTNRQIAALCGITTDAVKFHVANAIGKLGLADRKALKSWRGARIDSAVCSGEGSMSDGHRILGLGQVARSVQDVAVAEAWYRDVLGLTHLYTFGKLAFFDCGGTRLMLSEGEKLNPDESLLYLRVADINAAYARLNDLGVEFVGAPHRIHRHEDGTEEWMAFFKDPEGRPLALMSAVR